MSDANLLAEELGSRLQQARLNKNLTQDELAALSGLSRKVVAAAEQGECKLKNLISMLIALRLEDQLEALLPEQPLSPIQLALLQGKKRQRASSSSPKARTAIKVLAKSKAVMQKVKRTQRVGEKAVSKPSKSQW